MIYISQWKIETSKYNFTIIDVQGYRDLIKTVITGTSEANVAVLVVTSASGAFESCISKNGQRREHILLSNTLGVRQMNIAVNKMDEKTVNCSDRRTTRLIPRTPTSASTLASTLTQIITAP